MVFFELFAHNPNIVQVEAGKLLFSENDQGHLMYVLTNGVAEVRVNNRLVEVLQAGNIVGEMGIVSPGPRSASVQAQTHCEFVAVDEKRFHFLVQQVPFFATQVMRTLAERLRATNLRLPPLEDS
jgi:CRP-like cAMP-binding protein